uniref:HDC04199 n=1 Tax=Drosophila melanogaster TaxID=7227 RepID=Q6IGZ1_DROME|nr:TPA_inf: HDC04199 [Drosophila melanogaster]
MIIMYEMHSKPEPAGQQLTKLDKTGRILHLHLHLHHHSSPLHSTCSSSSETTYQPQAHLWPSGWGVQGGKDWPWLFWGQVAHLISPSDLQLK